LSATVQSLTNELDKLKSSKTRKKPEEDFQ